MREVRQVATVKQKINVGDLTAVCDQVLAVCTDDTLWVGEIIISDDAPPVVKWQPLNGPPDGEFWNKVKPFWDRMEEKVKDEIANHNKLETT